MLITIALLATLGAPQTDTLSAAFKNPPASAKPHTWWHWVDGNVTKEGITADLEAMKQVGMGGAQMFSAAQGFPAGDAKYMSKHWRDLTTHAIREAGRLGLELCIHNCAGWSSSGGPWIKPEDAMQVLAWSELKVQGPTHVSQPLPQPKAPQVYANVPYYKDIAVFAYPTTEGTTRLPNFIERTGVTRGDGLHVETTPVTGVINPQTVINITDKFSPDGTLNWDAPAGNWTILRMGHVPTGKDNHPAPPEGDGLEVDKLSSSALDKHWEGMMAKVLADAGPLAGKVLNNALIDSYEVYSQNWTPLFREEFTKRRGYDPLPYLPTIAGLVIESRERTERFLWDFRRTIADLYADNYYGHFRDLCHKNGLQFSTEPYGNGGFDTIQSGSKADIVMGEFWIGGGMMETTKLASSIGHVYGHEIVGAESFTADEGQGRWLEHPYGIKALGDQAFCNGINRYIFHRYAMQPWLNQKPGMTFGQYGMHLERTQTWWTEAATWMKYISRSQYLLQSGRFVADACYYYGEDSPADLAFGAYLRPQLPRGYDYDSCDAAALLSMTVKNGRLVLPSGMSYPLLILPESRYMTPAVARKVRDLVKAGATIYGPKPTGSPSLQDYPACDQEVRAIAQEIWGKPGLGKGHVIWGSPLAEVMEHARILPDFEYSPSVGSNKFMHIHRKTGSADIYFVSNQRYRPTEAQLTFRVTGKVPELWNPETGKTEDAPAYTEQDGRTSVPLRFGPAESMFVVFRKPAPKSHLKHVGPDPTLSPAPKLPTVQILKARYGTSDGRGVDVTQKVRAILKDGQFEVPASNALYGDPAVNVVKQLDLEYRVGNETKKKTIRENDILTLITLPNMDPAPSYEAHVKGQSKLEVTAWKPTNLLIAPPNERSKVIRYGTDVKSIDLSHNWQLSFPPNLGAPATAQFKSLISWPTHPNQGIKYFSGSALYQKEFNVPKSFLTSGRSLRLDLGEVKNFATVKLNGREVAVLWKAPFIADLTGLLKPGKNRLEIKVTNLWPNRLIGDEQLPEDAQFNGPQISAWPKWLTNSEPRPKTGRITFTTWHHYGKASPLLESGLLGPVKLQSAQKNTLRY